MRSTAFTFLLALTATCLATVAGPTAARAGDNWPSFRGPTGDGHSDSQGLPLTWSETENVKWKTPIDGKGWSSPVVWNGQIWLTTAPEDGKKLRAICVDFKSGKILHDKVVFAPAEPQFCHAMNSYATPTPAIEAGRVYVHFGVHGTACLDTKTGKTLWSRDDLPCNHFRGPASSPIIHGDLLHVNFDGFDLQYVVALDKATGKTVWKRDRGDVYTATDGDAKKAYSTPQIVEYGGRTQLISPGASATMAYDPESGEQLWIVKHGGMNASARPLFGLGKVFINTGAGGLNLFAVRPDGSGDVTDTHIEWKCNKGVPTRSSQLLIDDLIYMVSDSGIGSCIEAETGESVWQKRLGENDCASPIYADGRIYFFDEAGTAVVLAPGRKYDELARNKLDAGFMASPAVSGKSLILRTKTHLYRIAE